MDSPRGRIRLMKNVWEGRLGADAAAFDDHMNTCLDCRACETACPSGVEFGKLVEGARSQIVAARSASLGERVIRFVALDALLPHRRALAAFARFSYLSKRLGAGAALRAIGTVSQAARRLAGLLELVPDQAPTSEGLPRTVAARGTRRARAALFGGCVQRAVFGATNAATARVLARNGVEVTVIEDQTCCGALHAHAGERDGARALARRNIAAFERAGADVVVVNAAGCGAAGTYNVTRPELSRQLLERKVGHIKSTGAELVVTANPGCLMQIQSGLRREAPAVRVVHLIDLLDEAYGAS